MNSGQAQTVVVTTMAAAGVIVFVRAASQDRRPELRQGIGIAVAGVGLSAAAQVQPDLAGGLALLWLASQVFQNGQAFTALTRATKPTSSTTRTAPPAPVRYV